MLFERLFFLTKFFWRKKPGAAPKPLEPEAAPAAAEMADRDPAPAGRPEAQGKIRLKFPGFPEVFADRPIDWLMDPFNNKSWRWSLHVLRIIDGCFDEEGGLTSPAFLEASISSWLDEFSGRSKDTLYPAFCWNDHSAAVRLMRLLRVYEAVGKAPDRVSAGFAARLYLSIIEHLAFLSREDIYNRRTNHGMDQSIALIEGGKAVNIGLFTELGLSRFLDELAFAFTSEGAHKENSPGYHAYALRRFAEAVNRNRALFKPHEKIILEKFNGALMFLALALRPDGALPIIGDSSEKGCDYLASIPILAEAPAFKRFLLARGGGARGKRPPMGARALPESGWAFFRGGADNDFHLVYKAGSLSRFHYHQDEGSFVLYARGEDWIIDSGRYNYQEENPVRKLLRSRFAHNLPFSPEMEPADWDSALKGWKITAWSEEGESPFVCSMHSSVKNFVMERRVEAPGLSRVIIKDLITGKQKGASLEILFHAPIDKEISVQDRAAFLKGKNGVMKIEAEPGFFDSIILTRGFEAGAESFVSRDFNQLEPSQCLRFVFRFTGRLSSVIKLEFL